MLRCTHPYFSAGQRHNISTAQAANHLLHSPSAMKTITRNFERIQISRGLGDLDDKYDLLVGLYEKLHFATLEASDLAVDALTFANEACDFSLIIKTTHSRNYQVQNGEPNLSLRLYHPEPF